MQVVTLGLFVLASVSAEFARIPKYYFDEVGIPLARKIKAYEDSVLKVKGDGTFGDKIVGGVVAPVNSHPYLGGLVVSFATWPFTAACGSTLVSNTKLVTAAHCWNDGNNQATQFEVVLGSQFLFNGGTRIVTRNVLIHPQWSPWSWTVNDIAIITLPRPAPSTFGIRPIALPSPLDLAQTFTSETAMAAGYGKTSDAQSGVTTSTVISHVNLRVISEAECLATFQGIIGPSHICTSGVGGVGLCGGDSGGPLVLIRNGIPTLIGVSSFVASVNGVAVCEWGYPSVYSRVTSFYQFIMQNM